MRVSKRALLFVVSSVFVLLFALFVYAIGAAGPHPVYTFANISQPAPNQTLNLSGVIQVIVASDMNRSNISAGNASQVINFTIHFANISGSGLFNHSNSTNASKNNKQVRFNINTLLLNNIHYNITVNVSNGSDTIFYGVNITGTAVSNGNVSIIVDNIVPNTSIVFPLDEQNFSGEFAINVSANDSIVGVANVTINKIGRAHV